MEFSYRCLVCGNNTVLDFETTEENFVPENIPVCQKCDDGPELTLVTADNIDSLPQPTNPKSAEE